MSTGSTESTAAATATGLSGAGGRWALARAGSAPVVVDIETIRHVDRTESPRWVWWTQETAAMLVEAGIRPRRCWDLTAVDRMLTGRFRSTPGHVWANANGLDGGDVPVTGEPDLFTPVADPDPERPIRPDGHLDPAWADGAWRNDDTMLTTWAELAVRTAVEQERALHTRTGSARPAQAESAAAVLCAELEHDGLPFDTETAERSIAEWIGPRPRDAEHAAQLLRTRDEAVFRHLPDGYEPDLRSPDQVRALLRRVGVEVSDTRAWRLESHRDDHPAVDALLRWRKAERIATTFGYGWIDENVGPDGRLRGAWTPSDGAAGRMTATAGMHNMPSLLRDAVVAEPGHRFVRADLGQIEPRVLAAVSGDERLIGATREDDLYAPVARALDVERDVAKVAVLGAMYGQTTGHGAAALVGLEREYPQAMELLRAADVAAQGGNDLFTVGGRRIRMNAALPPGTPERTARSRAAARGRYGRNAVVQGAAAEFFKTWAALVRATTAPLGASIVLCLHDELLVHAPARVADEVADAVSSAVSSVPLRWGPPAAREVRFVADVAVITRWSDAKSGTAGDGRASAGSGPEVHWPR